MMINCASFWKRPLALLVCCCALLPAQAQFGGAQTTRRSSSGSGATRDYYNSSDVGDAVISVDPDTKRVVVITDEETSKYVAQVITNLDRPRPQVLIKVVFLEVTHTDALDIGVEGGMKKNIDGSSGTVGNAANVFGLSGLISTNGIPLNPLGQPVQSFQPAPPGAGLYQIVSQDYQVTLRAIAQAGKLEVLSRPSIMARNNQPATITVGQSVPLIDSVRYDNYGNAINSVRYTDIGIILRVTPFISSENLVEMIISPEISSLTSDTVAISKDAAVPVIAKRSADTVVVTGNRETVIIGGLMANNKTVSVSKIPLLGDIPLLGAAFRHKVTQNQKTELIIFLTPIIVETPEQFAALSKDERDQTQMAPKAFSEEELNRFLKGVPAKGEDATSDPKSKKSSKSKK